METPLSDCIKLLFSCVERYGISALSSGGKAVVVKLDFRFKAEFLKEGNGGGMLAVQFGGNLGIFVLLFPLLHQAAEDSLPVSPAPQRPFDPHGKDGHPFLLYAEAAGSHKGVPGFGKVYRCIRRIAQAGKPALRALRRHVKQGRQQRDRLFPVGGSGLYQGDALAPLGVLFLREGLSLIGHHVFRKAEDSAQPFDHSGNAGGGGLRDKGKGAEPPPVAGSLPEHGGEKSPPAVAWMDKGGYLPFLPRREHRKKPGKNAVFIEKIKAIPVRFGVGLGIQIDVALQGGLFRQIADFFQLPDLFLLGVIQLMETLYYHENVLLGRLLQDQRKGSRGNQQTADHRLWGEWFL